MATKQRKIEINYRLLQTSCNIEVVGSVPDMQVYQADKAEYTPDLYADTAGPVSAVQRHRSGSGD